METSKSVANNQIADQIDGPWSLFGDFNVLLQDHKHCGGSQRALLCGDMAFQNFVQDYHLMDKGYQGDPFTYVGSSSLGIIKKRGLN